MRRLLRRNDRGTQQVSEAKRDEYASARIPFYWNIDVGQPVTLTAMHLAESWYEEAPEQAVAYKAADPFPVTIDIDQLC